LSGIDRYGLLLVDKPPAMTSHDVVNILRRKLGIKKIGHAGTLDPHATGLLILLIGRQATKKSQQYSGLAKRYDAVMTLGVKTDSQDHTGRVILKRKVPRLSKELINKTLKKFSGEISQIPPMVSAKKIGGETLYKLARRGITIDRKPATIKINKITLKKIELPQIHFSLSCSKGTYVRALCNDIGEFLGCGAHMSFLRRTQIGEFKLKGAKTISWIKQASPEEIFEHVKELS